jgi:hypothetical protein
VKLGLLGALQGELGALVRAAGFLLNEARVSRAVYLGDDDALDAAVAVWAESLVGGDASDSGLWERALPLVEGGTPARLDAFRRAERGRLRLRALEGLPPVERRSVEMIGDHLALLVHDTELLDEEDIYAAALLLYGKSDAPVAKRIGPRWFLSPGPVGVEGGGALVLDDSSDDVVATFYDLEGREIRRQPLGSARAGVFSVGSS